MHLCSFDNNYKIFDVTPIENIFIQEFMLRAPGDFVKIYIYGLSLCYDRQPMDITTFTKALGMDIETVENGLQYWERQGIVQLERDGNKISSINFYNIKDVVYNKNYNMDKTLYQYKDFNENLQLVFGTRLLTPQEYIKIYDWVEMLNLPKEVILMMVQFYLDKKGPNLSINYLDKVAMQWAKDGINTLQKAEEYIQTNESCYKETVAVLKYLGIRRPPSKVELEMYRKWRNVWGFSLNAILQACKETAKAQSPSFAYLNKILENMHRQGFSTPEQILDYQAARESINHQLQDVLYNLGQRNVTATPKHRELYIKWTEKWQFEHSVILLACKECVRHRVNTFNALDSLLHRWLDNGLHTYADIKAYIGRRDSLDIDIKAILDRAGENRAPTQSDRKLFMKWIDEWGLPYEVILLAAEYSIAAQNKMPFINKVLENWYSNNITTISQAKKEHQQHKARTTTSQSRSNIDTLDKQVDFNKFEQHQYTDDDLEALFEDIENA